jgi:hypothetical protein
MTIRMSTKAAMAAIFAIGSMQPLAAQRVARGPQFHPNTQKYSDAGAKPVGGRSGSASLQARAMLGEDGTVLVEASTGDLDASTAPGQIRKMQMKVVSPAGKATSTQNFIGGESGRWSTSVARLGAGSTLQLQANIGGIDERRNDVVTVTVPVKRRPDVAVNGVSAPSRALAGVPMNVVASVSERNGDMGARANCMLQIDGQLADQARGIWVDAGQTVSCAFQTRVTTVGSHNVTVYVTGVSPSDWDGSDNSASTLVEVLSPETALAYSASFKSTDEDYFAHTKNSSADGSYVEENTSSGKRQERLFSISSWTTAESFSFPTRVRSALLADGAPVFDYSNDIVLEPGASTATSDCGEVITGRFFLSVCNLRVGTPRSEVTVSSFDGRVTYFGSKFIQFEGEDTYISSSSDTPTGLGAYPVNSSVQLVVELRDARGMLFAARPTMSLQAKPIDESYNSCFLNPYNQVTYCADGKTTGTSRSGTANAGSN